MTLLEKLRKAVGHELSRSIVATGSDDDEFTFEPATPGGMRVMFLRQGPFDFLVYLEGWLENFPYEEQAVDLFVRAVTGEARVWVTSRNGCDYRWRAEVLEDNEWRRLSGVAFGFMIPWFWQRPAVRCLQNPRAADEVNEGR